MGNVPWDGTGFNCYGMGMGQINMSHGQPCKFTLLDLNLHKNKNFRCSFKVVVGKLWASSQLWDV